MTQTHTTTTRRPPTTKPLEPAAHDTELVDTMGELLDEIDTVLEENAWVTNYRQRGGQ